MNKDKKDKLIGGLLYIVDKDGHFHKINDGVFEAPELDKPEIIMDTHIPKVIADGLINEILTADISDLNNLEIEAELNKYIYYIEISKTERGLEVKLESITKEVYQNRDKK